MDGWTLVRFLHLLAITFFVGGQLMLAAVVTPALRGQDRALMREAAKRFGIGSAAALAVIIATGAAMASHYHRWSDGTLHVKLALVVLVAALILWHLRQGAAHWLQAAIFLVSLVIVWLGVSLAH
jgi:uncharacterized membrane protein